MRSLLLAVLVVALTAPRLASGSQIPDQLIRVLYGFDAFVVLSGSHHQTDLPLEDSPP